jgi:hypothetical protein
MNPSPFDACLREAASAKAGGERVGVDKQGPFGPPSPSSPPTVGRGDSRGHSKK